MRAVTMTALLGVLLAGAIGCAPTYALRVNCGGEKDYVDQHEVKWLADRGAKGGDITDRPEMTMPLAQRPELYLTERYGMSAYEFPVDNGTYCVKLHFAETWGPHTEAGMRVFSVKINGEMKLEDFDIFAQAGGFARPIVMTCDGIAVTDGKIRIDFIEKVQNTEINAIEILRY